MCVCVEPCTLVSSAVLGLTLRIGLSTTGVVFLNLNDPDGSDNTGERAKRQASSRSGSDTGSDLPKHIRYKIRQDTDNTPTTREIRHQ